MFVGYKRYLFAVFLFFVLLNGFIFRSFIFDFKDLVQGKKVIVWEELVPIFDMKSQFFDQLNGGWSELTQGKEGRIGYSALTSWTRYYKILPFSLILLNSVSCFFIFLSILFFLHYFLKRKDSIIIFFSCLSSTSVYLLLLYSKITHFYTLIFGFSTFSLAVTLFLISIYYLNKVNWSLVFFISILVFINPAIHFHIIFYLVQFFVLILLLFKLPIKDRAEVKRAFFLFIMIFFLSLTPYIIFIFSTVGTSITQNFSLNIFTIEYASMNFQNLFLFDSASQVNMGVYGSYITKTPSYINLLITIPFLAPLFFIKIFELKQRKVLLGLYLLFLIFFGFTLGTNFRFSIYSLVNSIIVILTNFSDVFSAFLLKIIYIILGVLRLPHRFQFVLFYFLGLILPLFYIFLFNKFKNKHVGLFVILLIVFFPFIITRDYRSTLFSGDFRGFLKPWPIEEDLVKIKDIIKQEGDGTIFLLPSLESGRVVLSSNSQSNSFLDKYYIYQLNNPSIYYGTAANLENKVKAFLIYRSIAYGEGWWKNFLISFTDVKYLLINKRTHTKDVGTVYLSNLEEKMYNGFVEHNKIKLIYSSDSFDLYKIDNETKPRNCLVDLVWFNFLKINSKDLKSNEQANFFLPLTFNKEKELSCLITDNPIKAYLDFYALNFDENYFDLPPYYYVLSKNIISSSRYYNSTLSMFTLFIKNNHFNYFKESLPGVYYSLKGDFFGLTPSDTKIKIPFKVSKNGQSALLLRSMNNGAHIKYKIFLGNKLILSKERLIENVKNKDTDFDYFEVFNGDLLEGNNYSIEILNFGDKVFIGDGLLIITKEKVPSYFSEGDKTFLSINENGCFYNIIKENFIKNLNGIDLYSIYKSDKSILYNKSNNILNDNPSFESGLWNNKTIDCSSGAPGEADVFSEITENSIDGKKAILLSSNNHDACIYKKFEVSLKKNHYYKLSFNYKNISGARVKYYYKLTSEDGIKSYSEDINVVNNEWNIYEKIFLPEDDYNYFFIYLYSPSNGENVINIYDKVNLSEISIIK